MLASTVQFSSYAPTNPDHPPTTGQEPTKAATRRNNPRTPHPHEHDAAGLFPQDPTACQAMTFHP